VPNGMRPIHTLLNPRGIESIKTLETTMELLEHMNEPEDSWRRAHTTVSEPHHPNNSHLSAFRSNGAPCPVICSRIGNSRRFTAQIPANESRAEDVKVTWESGATKSAWGHFCVTLDTSFEGRTNGDRMIFYPKNIVANRSWDPSINTVSGTYIKPEVSIFHDDSLWTREKEFLQDQPTISVLGHMIAPEGREGSVCTTLPVSAIHFSINSHLLRET